MLKWIGLCFVAAGTAGTGMRICLDRKARIAQLARLGQMFGRIAGEVSYSRTGISEILEELGEKMKRSGDFSLGGTLEAIGRELRNGGGLTELWREKMSAYMERSLLRREEKELVLSFPETVDFPDAQRQRTAVEAFAGAMDREKEAARKKEAEENRMTMAVCLAGGILAGLLLL